MEQPETQLKLFRDLVQVCKRNGILQFEGCGFKIQFLAEAVERKVVQSSLIGEGTTSSLQMTPEQYLGMQGISMDDMGAQLQGEG